MKKRQFNIPSGVHGERADKLRHAKNLLALGEKALQAGSIDEGLIFYQEAFSISAGVLGIDHAEVIRLAEMLAESLSEQGQPAEAREFFARSLASGRYDPELPYLAALIDRLGNWFFSKDDLVSTRRYFELALDGFRQAYGVEDHRVIYGLQKLIGLLYNLGDLPAARTALERVLAIDERVFGKEHPRVAADLSSLGRLLREMSDLPGAADHYRRAMALHELSVDPATLGDHPRLSSDLAGLAEVLHEMRDYAGARAAYERLLVLEGQTYGPEHRKVASTLSNLIALLYEMGDLPAALQAAQNMLAIYERFCLSARDTIHSEASLRVYEEACTHFLSALERVGMLQHEAADLTGARHTLERALEFAKSEFGPKHLRLTGILARLGHVLADLHDEAGARSAYENALAIYENTVPANHPEPQRVRQALETLNRSSASGAAP